MASSRRNCTSPMAAAMSFMWHFRPISSTKYCHQYDLSVAVRSHVPLSMPSQRSRLLRCIHCSSFKVSAPPSPMARFFTAWKLKQPMSPIEPTLRPLYRAPVAWAQSSMIGISPAISFKASRSIGRPE